tara:strand:- start:10226 stop:10849 length:624 start_codon:yes stop_codon:yes gene_type:complete
MAISTYAELQTSIANFLARDDLTSVIPDFIQLAEARMSRELETRSQEKRAIAPTVAGDEFISLPTDLRKIRLVKLNTDPVDVLDYAAPQDYYETYPSSGGGRPRIYTVIGTEIALRPIPDSVLNVEIIYSEDVSALSASNTTNTVLSRHPDTYLFGSLSAAHMFLMDEQRATQYDAIFTRAMEEVKKDNEKAFFGSPLTMKTEYLGA